MIYPKPIPGPVFTPNDIYFSSASKGQTFTLEYVTESDPGTTYTAEVFLSSIGDLPEVIAVEEGFDRSEEFAYFVFHNCETITGRVLDEVLHSEFKLYDAEVVVVPGYAVDVRLRVYDPKSARLYTISVISKRPNMPVEIHVIDKRHGLEDLYAWIAVSRRHIETLSRAASVDYFNATK